jgi:four helix bundle protein
MGTMSSQVKSFRDLKIWQRAMDLVPQVYQVAHDLPDQERYVLANQLRRAVVSVPANIAEGQMRLHRKEFVYHLSIARGSVAELQTLLLVAERLGYVTRDQLTPVEKTALDVLMPLTALINRLQRVL